MIACRATSAVRAAEPASGGAVSLDGDSTGARGGETPLSHFRGTLRRLDDSHVLHNTQARPSTQTQVVVRETLGWTDDERAADYTARGSWICAVTAHNHVVELALARGDHAIDLVMRGELLLRHAASDAEPASAIAGASSRGRITMREQPRRSLEIAEKLLGLVAGQCAGPTAQSCGFTIELSPSRMRTAFYIRVANGTLKRSSDLRTLAPLAIMRFACRLALALCSATLF